MTETLTQRQKLEAVRARIVEANPSIDEKICRCEDQATCGHQAPRGTVRFGDTFLTVEEDTFHSFLNPATPEMLALSGYSRPDLTVGHLLLSCWNFYEDDLEKQTETMVNLLHHLLDA